MTEITRRQFVSSLAGLIIGAKVIECPNVCVAQTPMDQIAIGMVSRDIARHWGSQGILLDNLGRANIYMGLSRLDEYHVRSSSMNHINGNRDNESYSRTFVCNYWNDFNGDGKMQLNEFVGMDKRDFLTEDKLTVGMKIARGALNHNGTIKVFGPRGQEAYVHSEPFHFDNVIRRRELNIGNLVNNSGAGTYAVAFYYDGGFWEARSFELRSNYFSKPLFFNYWNDFNGDGSGNSSEFIGLGKQLFRTNEEFHYGIQTNLANSVGKRLSTKIHAPNGRTYDGKGTNIPSQNNIWFAKLRLAETTVECGFGTYNVDFYLNGDKINSGSFQVNE